MTAPGPEPQAVAVIGMAGRFPGAGDVSEFWRNLRDGVESVVDLDADELVRRGADPALVAAEDYVRPQLLLDGIDEFDAGFFGYSPTDAAILDPQHRLLLECAWHALEDAGCIPGRFDGTIGVYAGASMSGYLHANLLRGRTLDASPDSLRLLFGNDKDYLATRISYQLDLTGPALSVQTACSTSLVAVHLAAQALLSYECAPRVSTARPRSLPRHWRWRACRRKRSARSRRMAQAPNSATRSKSPRCGRCSATAPIGTRPCCSAP